MIIRGQQQVRDRLRDLHARIITLPEYRRILRTGVARVGRNQKGRTIRLLMRNLHRQPTGPIKRQPRRMLYREWIARRSFAAAHAVAAR